MQFIQDGTGLNALLQNYWMVIHPPVLFLGFASITVPLYMPWPVCGLADTKIDSTSYSI